METGEFTLYEVSTYKTAIQETSFFRPGASVHVIGETVIHGSPYYLCLWLRLTLTDEIIVLPKSYFKEDEHDGSI